MRTTAKYLATTSLVLVTNAAAWPSWAADIDATSAIDTVTVYPDGATVTRVIALDLASGDSTGPPASSVCSGKRRAVSRM